MGGQRAGDPIVEGPVVVVAPVHRRVRLRGLPEGVAACDGRPRGRHGRELGVDLRLGVGEVVEHPIDVDPEHLRRRGGQGGRGATPARGAAWGWGRCDPPLVAIRTTPTAIAATATTAASASPRLILMSRRRPCPPRAARAARTACSWARSRAAGRRSSVLAPIREANVSAWARRRAPPAARPRRRPDHVVARPAQALERLAAERARRGVGPVVQTRASGQNHVGTPGGGRAQPQLQVLAVEEDRLVERPQPAQRVGARDERASHRPSDPPRRGRATAPARRPRGRAAAPAAPPPAPGRPPRPGPGGRCPGAIRRWRAPAARAAARDRPRPAPRAPVSESSSSSTSGLTSTVDRLG